MFLLMVIVTVVLWAAAMALCLHVACGGDDEAGPFSF